MLEKVEIQKRMVEDTQKREIGKPEKGEGKEREKR